MDNITTGIITGTADETDVLLLDWDKVEVRSKTNQQSNGTGKDKNTTHARTSEHNQDQIQNRIMEHTSRGSSAWLLDWYGDNPKNSGQHTKNPKERREKSNHPWSDRSHKLIEVKRMAQLHYQNIQKQRWSHLIWTCGNNNVVAHRRNGQQPRNIHLQTLLKIQSTIGGRILQRS